MTGWWNIPNYTFFPNSADSDLLVCFRDGLSLYLPPASERCPLWFFFLFFSSFCLFPECQFGYLFSPAEDALNPMQVVFGGTHTERGWLLTQYSIFLSLFHILQHTEGPALCKTGGREEGEGRLCSASIGWSFCLSLTNSPRSVFLSFFGCFESSTLLSFLCPLTEPEQD